MLQMHNSNSSINQIENNIFNKTSSSINESSNVNNISSSIHHDSFDKINTVKNDLRRFSYISTDTSSNGDDIESALFNDENLFRTNTNSDNSNSNSNTNGSNNINISSTLNSNASSTSITNRFNIYNLKSPQKVHTRPSMKMIPEDDSLFRSNSNRYNYISHQNSKLSLVSSLADITNLTNLSSNISPSRNNLSRRTSNLSNQSYPARRNYSLTENGSIISMEQKRNQIIQRLNKRNSKNISNPYFYQYKEKNQPEQAPPNAPEFDQDSYYNDHGVINMSNHTNLISPTSETFSDFNSTDESLHFVDRSNINSTTDSGHQIFRISEATSNPQNDHNYTPMNSADTKNNIESTSNNTSYDTANTTNNNTNNTNNTTGNNSGNTSSHYSSHHSGNYGRSDRGNTSSSSNNTKDTTQSSDTSTTTSDENRFSRRIRDSQRNSSGLFSELSFLSATAPLVPRAVVDATIEETEISNDSNLHDSKGHGRNSSKLSDSVSTVSTHNLNLDQFVVVNRSRPQPIRPFPLSMTNASNSIQDSGITDPGPVLTIKNIGSHDSPESNESRLRKFSLANNSSISVLHAKKIMTNQSPNETLLEKPHSGASSMNSSTRDKFLIVRKPPPPPPPPSSSLISPLTGASPVVPIQSAIKSFVASSHDSISSYSKKVPEQEANDEVPAIPTFPITLTSSFQERQKKSESNNFQTAFTQTGDFTHVSGNSSPDNSFNSYNTNKSNGSREKLLKSEKKKSTILPFKLVSSYRISGKSKSQLELDLEKGNNLDEDYSDSYHYYEYDDRCSDMISILFILISLLAPPFWLLIGLGYLDQSFGKIDKKYKITCIVLFSVFCVGAILGIAIGFGYGLTHRR